MYEQFLGPLDEYGQIRSYKSIHEPYNNNISVYKKLQETDKKFLLSSYIILYCSYICSCKVLVCSYLILFDHMRLFDQEISYTHQMFH